MGGDSEPNAVDELSSYIRLTYPEMKTGWYTGRTLISSHIHRQNFDYIKVGPYIAHLGPLKNPTTNQRLYRVEHPSNELIDITSRFWKK